MNKYIVFIVITFFTFSRESLHAYSPLSSINKEYSPIASDATYSLICNSNEETYLPMSRCTIPHGRAIPGPEMGLTDEQKRKKGKNEFRIFAQMVGHFSPERWEISKMPYTDITGIPKEYLMYVDRQDPDKNEKIAGVLKGIEILINRGIAIPYNLKVFITEKKDIYEQPECCVNGIVKSKGGGQLITNPNNNNNPICREALTLAVKRDRYWQPIANVLISTVKKTHCSGTLAHVNESNCALSGMGINGYKKTVITTIHEIGHIIHERHAGEFFWTEELNGRPILRGPQSDPEGNNISYYGARKKREFVAEVFTGLVLGIPNLERFSEEYIRYRGPYYGLFNQ